MSSGRGGGDSGGGGRAEKEEEVVAKWKQKRIEIYRLYPARERAARLQGESQSLFRTLPSLTQFEYRDPPQYTKLTSSRAY